MRYKILLVTLFCLLLCGCTREADRVYTVCKVSTDGVYCYKADSTFYKYVDGDCIPVPNVKLIAKPAIALHNYIIDGSYSFNEKLPGCYSATLDDVGHYLAKCSDAELTVVYADANTVEAYLTAPTYCTKLYYTTDDSVHIYSVDAAGNPIDPPFISGESHE